MVKIPDYLDSEYRKKLKIYFKILKGQCKKCNGSGHIIPDPEQHFYEDCPNCTLKIQELKKYFFANISYEYLDITLDDLKNTFTDECYEGFKKLHNQLDKLIGTNLNLLIHKAEDNYSYGVTTSGILLLRKLIDKNFNCAIVDINELMENFFNFGNSDEEDFKRTESMSYYRSVQILMIDNFGFENHKISTENSFAYSKFASFLMLRKLNNKFTILCSEFPLEILYQHYEGTVSKHLKLDYLAFQVQCITGKSKHQASTKIKRLIPELDGIFTGSKK